MLNNVLKRNYIYRIQLQNDISLFIFDKMPKKYSSVKKCFVPMCGSSSYKLTDKLFIKVPLDIELRRKWFKSVNKTLIVGRETETYHCCEDHFDFNIDLIENSINKTDKTFDLTETSVPHLLKCQDDYRKALCEPPTDDDMKQFQRNPMEGRTTVPVIDENKMEIDKNGREFKKIVYGNKKMTLYIKSFENDEPLDEDSDSNDSVISSISSFSISSVSSTGLSTSLEYLSSE